MQSNSHTLLRVKEAAEYLGISKCHVYRLVERQQIPHYRNAGGKIIYFREQDLASFAMDKFYPAKPVEQI